LTIILNPSLGFNDKVIVQSVEEFFYSSSWMGTVSNVIFLITGPLVGLLANIFPTKFKIMLIIFVILSLVFSIWFSFAIYGWGSSNPVYFFISYCLCCTFTSTAIPIYYEAAVECTYPIGEGII
jgi:MFS family permease